MDREILRIYVNVTGSVSVRGKEKAVNLLTFGGYADSPFFKGDILPCGVDTQTLYPDGRTFLSARYMLSGTDCDGNVCRIFIENSVSPDINKGNTTSPVIVTDSPVLSVFEKAPLKGFIEPAENGIVIVIKTE